MKRIKLIYLAIGLLFVFAFSACEKPPAEEVPPTREDFFFGGEFELDGTDYAYAVAIYPMDEKISSIAIYPKAQAEERDFSLSIMTIGDPDTSIKYFGTIIWNDGSHHRSEANSLNLIDNRQVIAERTYAELGFDPTDRKKAYQPENLVPILQKVINEKPEVPAE